MPSHQLKNVAQIKNVKFDFKDITILVGNRAIDKSIFLQMYTLVINIGYIKIEYN